MWFSCQTPANSNIVAKYQLAKILDLRALVEEFRTTPKTKKNFDVLTGIIRRVISVHGNSDLSYDLTVKYFHVLQQIAPLSALEEVSQLFKNFAQYFSISAKFPQVVNSIGNFLLQCQETEGDIPYIVFIDDIMEWAQRLELTELYEKLQIKRSGCILNILKNCEKTGQISFALRQYIIILNDKSEANHIRASACKKIIHIFNILKCPEIAENYKQILLNHL